MKRQEVKFTLEEEHLLICLTKLTKAAYLKYLVALVLVREGVHIQTQDLGRDIWAMNGRKNSF